RRRAESTQTAASPQARLRPPGSEEARRRYRGPVRRRAGVLVGLLPSMLAIVVSGCGGAGRLTGDARGLALLARIDQAYQRVPGVLILIPAAKDRREVVILKRGLVAALEARDREFGHE